MGHFFSKVSLFIDKKETAAHLILDQDFATAPCFTKSGLILSHQPFFGVYHQVLLHPYIFEQSEPFALQ